MSKTAALLVIAILSSLYVLLLRDDIKTERENESLREDLIKKQELANDYADASGVKGRALRYCYEHSQRECQVYQSEMWRPGINQPDHE